MRFDDDDDLGDDELPESCPMCDGPAGILGALGRLVHWMCRDCGWMFSREK